MASSPTPSTSSTPKKLRKRKIVEKMSDETPKKSRFDRTKNEKYKQLVKKSIKRLASQDQQQQRQAVVHQEPPPPRPPTRRGQVEFDIDRRSPDLRVDKPLRQKNLNERKR